MLPISKLQWLVLGLEDWHASCIHAVRRQSKLKKEEKMKNSEHIRKSTKQNNPQKTGGMK
jgi:hypothetical protein